MAREAPDLWHAAPRGGEGFATEEDYEHGYKREVRHDLQQYIAFRVGSERYGVSIGDVSEISMVLGITPVPRTADFVQGIANIRGVVIPVVELSTRLLLTREQQPPRPRLLIVRHEEELYGLLVDEVYAVVTIAPEALEDAPAALTGARGDYIRALARDEGEILIILDLTTVLDARDFVVAGARGIGR